MQEAKLDITYCTNDKCESICWRHKSNFNFKDNENYWFMKYCNEYLSKINFDENKIDIKEGRVNK